MYETYFGESVMITFELPDGCTKHKRMTFRQKMANLELNIEFVIRVESFTLEQTNELCACTKLGGVTSQLAHAWNHATVPSKIESYAEHCVNGNDGRLNTSCEVKL